MRESLLSLFSDQDDQLVTMIRQLLTIYSIATTDKEVQDRLRDR